ncbi:MAG: hypothetical protein CM15mP84_00700 [Cellvibrionales bacterium]|nr:MAG: hypothetical protein CM15mP84_00700 [Cellvibrionales bacterium]
MNCMPPMLEAGIKRIVNGAIPTQPTVPHSGAGRGHRQFLALLRFFLRHCSGSRVRKYLAQWMIYGDSEINMTGFDPRRFGDFADRAYMHAKGFRTMADLCHAIAR